MNKKKFINKVHGNLIASCQALPGEPLYTEEGGIMPLMAKTAQGAGATGLRASSVRDIRQIKKVIDLPMIGIIKRGYLPERPHIAPTMREIDELMRTGVGVIVLDYILRSRHDGKTVAEFIKGIKVKYPSQLLMTDASNFEETKNACEADVDFVGTTLSSYTEESPKTDRPDLGLIKALVDDGLPMIAGGKIHTPEQLKQVIDINPAGIVVSDAIAHPFRTAKAFTSVFGK